MPIFINISRSLEQEYEQIAAYREKKSLENKQNEE